jgi:glycosyltransferase involved in cell wall biosynthesis
MDSAENQAKADGFVTPRMVVVSDSVDELDGVAIGLRRLIADAASIGYPMQLLGGAKGNDICVDASGVVRAPARLQASLPFYASYTWTLPKEKPLRHYLSQHADMVQCSTPGPMGMVAMRAARRLGLPVLAQYHTEIADYATLLTKLHWVGRSVEPWVAHFYRQADYCLAPSEAVSRRLVGFGVSQARIRRVPRGIDTVRFHPRRRRGDTLTKYGIGSGPTVMYVGRLSREKNLKILLTAWRAIASQLPTAQLVFVGDGPARAGIVGPRVFTTGALRGEALADAFAAADIFAFPSETETFGNAVVEALASGLPCVVADAGAAHEHVTHGETGLVVPGNDAAQWSNALSTLVRDASTRRRMGRAARRSAQRYEQRGATLATLQLYRELSGAVQ